MDFSAFSPILILFLLFLFIAMCMGCFYVCKDEEETQETEQEFYEEQSSDEELYHSSQQETTANEINDIVPNALNEEEGLAQADDLKQIKGIGVKLEKLLNSLGVYTFKQIANWTNEDAAKVDTYLKFPGRIERDEWIKQAKEIINKEA